MYFGKRSAFTLIKAGRPCLMCVLISLTRYRRTPDKRNWSRRCSGRKVVFSRFPDGIMLAHSPYCEHRLQIPEPPTWRVPLSVVIGDLFSSLWPAQWTCIVGPSRLPLADGGHGTWWSGDFKETCKIQTPATKSGRAVSTGTRCQQQLLWEN